MSYTHQKPVALDKVAPNNNAPYGTGTILRLSGHTLAVYKKAVPEKGYHLVLLLGPGGAVKAQGISLDGYEIEELGSIAPKWFALLESEMRWERDLIVFHCYSYEDVAKLPKADGNETEPRMAIRPATAAPRTEPETQPETAEPDQAPYAPVATAPAKVELNGNLRRGQRLQIKFGSNAWDAVYWGKDDQGQVIAHKTYENWSLMHLDLQRFATTMQVDPEADLTLVQEIEKSLLQG
jgi:hypothetical protein